MIIGDVQVVVRRKPKLTIYVRKVPAGVYRPTRGQADARRRFLEVVKESSLLTIEDVARLVGGRVVEVNGRKIIEMPDGRHLMKHMAYVKHMLSNYKSPYSRVSIPAWLEELSKKYYISLPSRAIMKKAE